MIRSVRARLLALNAFVLSLALVFLGVVLRVWVARSLIASVDRDLEERAKPAMAIGTFFLKNEAQIKQLGKTLGKSAKGLFPQPPPSSPPGDVGPPSQWTTRAVFKFYDFEGKRLGTLPADRPFDMRGVVAARRGETSVRTVKVGRESVRLLTMPVYREKELVAALQGAYSLADVERATGSLDAILLSLVPVALIASALGGAFLMRKAMRPVRTAAKAAARIGVENLSERLPVVGGDEFSELAQTFNGLLERLQESFEQQRRFAADASHELKSPLTVVKAGSSLLEGGSLPATERRAAASIAAAAAHMERIVKDLLMLAKADAGALGATRLRIDVRSLVDLAIACVDVNGGPTIEVDVEDGLSVVGDEAQLTRLLVNLLDNAVRHTPKTGRVVVSGASDRNTVRLAVRDTGTGIAPEHIPRLTERFYRVDEGRARSEGGTGLGLAICQSIAQAHGGTIALESRIDVGTTATVVLPLV